MHVSAILKNKGSRVETARPEMTAGELTKKLTEKGIGALVVCDPRGHVMGIISERDVIHALAEHGAAALTKTVGELMTPDVISCSPDDDLKHVMEVMTMRRFRHLPVMNEGELKGIVSIGDVVKHRLDEQELEVNVLRDYVRSY
ncbi:MAG: CBS domain-containing protein [Alphaproteobacteria bacterium]|nr:CBS domain-containing protein [Alphaproteobacteria bacterium]